MNANAEKWVAALESGEYKQTTGALRKGDAFCCLGVACDLAVKEGVIPPPRDLDDSTFLYGTPEDSDAAILPWPVKEWLGVYSLDGSYDADGGRRVAAVGDGTAVDYNALTIDNDSGASFAEIAQTIRTHPELFVDGES